MSEKKKVTNLILKQELASIYGNVDGLSLQNLFYTHNGYFPNCYMFTRSGKCGDNYIDTANFLKYLIENTPEDEELTHITYSTLDLSTNEEHTGFCAVFNKSNLYVRIENSISESYILYGNDDVEALNKFVEDFKKYYVAPEEEKNNLFLLGTTQAGYTLIKSHVKEVEDFDVNKHYNDDFLPEYEKIDKFIDQNDRSGLVILHGEKGTGKTTYIRHLINKYPNKKFVNVPSNMITLLSEPSFGSFLLTLNNHVIILEDCENAIRDRKVSGTGAAVSLLLNMTDGLLSDDLGIKFICTFNDDVRNIDQALMRKGRLVSKYEFKPLCVEKTNNLLKELSFIGEDTVSVTTPMTLADIFNYEDTSYETKRTSII